ncbi:hypothetical protein ACYZUD_10555 [Pseudomonas sp. XS1P51]
MNAASISRAIQCLQFAIAEPFTRLACSFAITKPASEYHYSNNLRAGERYQGSGVLPRLVLINTKTVGQKFKGQRLQVFSILIGNVDISTAAGFRR